MEILLATARSATLVTGWQHTAIYVHTQVTWVKKILANSNLHSPKSRFTTTVHLFGFLCCVILRPLGIAVKCSLLMAWFELDQVF